jgi:voltage-gated sodium channel
MTTLWRLHRSRARQIVVGMTILVNAIVLGALTELPEGSPDTFWLERLDTILLAILVADVLLTIAAKRTRVLRSGWDVFDITVTLVSVVPHVEMLSALRVLRILRVLRLVSFIPHGRATVDALLRAMHTMMAAFVVLSVVFYSFVVIATNLFRDIDPERYGSLGRAATHVYSFMVTFGADLDAEPVIREAPWSLFVFAPFIFVASFGMLNLIIAILVVALREQMDSSALRKEQQRLDRIEQKVDAITAIVRQLSSLPPAPTNGGGDAFRDTSLGQSGSAVEHE